MWINDPVPSSLLTRPKPPAVHFYRNDLGRIGRFCRRRLLVGERARRLGLQMGGNLALPLFHHFFAGLPRQPVDLTSADIQFGEFRYGFGSRVIGLVGPAGPDCFLARLGRVVVAIEPQSYPLREKSPVTNRAVAHGFLYGRLSPATKDCAGFEGHITQLLAFGAGQLVWQLLVLQFQGASNDTIEDPNRRLHCYLFNFIDAAITGRTIGSPDFLGQFLSRPSSSINGCRVCPITILCGHVRTPP
jgi:hypothetical protein